MKIAVIGAGAAGCFFANVLRQLRPRMIIDMYESGQRPLRKVAITGGGRCNLTNTFAEVRDLQQVYPRGYNLMKRLLRQFDHEATMRWFEERGVALVVQSDQCVFPASQDAMQIVGTLMEGMQGVRIFCNERVRNIVVCENADVCEANRSPYRVVTDKRDEAYDVVIVTSGGSPRATGLNFLDGLQLEMVAPVPSLFSFNIGADKAGSDVRELMGIVVDDAMTSLAGTRFKSYGPLLITHWGMSGPAILRLSSAAARWLAERDYRATLLVNWMGGVGEDVVRERLRSQLAEQPSRQIGGLHLLTSRLWNHLLKRAGIAPERRCSEVGSKQLNKLASVLTNDNYAITGQCRTKDEFVTCGGVALSNVDPATLQCRRHPGIYLAGEVLDVDGVTGGFNLQAAWTMGYTVAHAIDQMLSGSAQNDM